MKRNLSWITACLAVGALARGYALSGDERYRNAAERAVARQSRRRGSSPA